MNSKVQKNSPLRRARRKRGLTQFQVAVETELSVGTIHYIENGITRNGSNIKTVADYLGVDMDTVLDWHESIDAENAA